MSIEDLKMLETRKHLATITEADANNTQEEYEDNEDRGE
jgi:hypothetical protein